MEQAILMQDRHMIRKPYPTDLLDPEWDYIAPFVGQKPGRGRRRTVNMREIVNAILYMNKTGCQWNMIPHDFPEPGHISYYYYLWQKDGTLDTLLDTVRRDVRVSEGRDPEPSAAILDSQSVKIAGNGDEVGFDGNKRIKGRKRHIAVDILGLLILVWVTRANMADRDGGAQLCDELQQTAPRVRKVWADSAYGGDLVGYVACWCRFILEIVKKLPEQKGFQVQPKRWIVERTFAWLNQQRRLSKEYEHTPESSESMIKIAAIRLMLRRLTLNTVRMIAAAFIF
jgi:putative transposase